MGEHIPAEGDAAFESYSGEIRALPAFRIRPCAQGRNDPGQRGADKSQEVEIGANGLNPAAIFRPVRTELQQLNNSSEILTCRGCSNSGNVLYLG